MGKIRSFMVGKHVSLITSADMDYWSCYIESAFEENDMIFLRCELEDGEVNYVSLDTVCNFFEDKKAQKKLKQKQNNHLTVVK